MDSDIYSQNNGEKGIQENGEEGQQQQKSYRKNAPRTASECIQTFKNMFAFDWDLKDIVNLRHSPRKLIIICIILKIDQELTHAVFWFYVNSLYFPFRSYDLLETPFEDFENSIL